MWETMTLLTCVDNSIVSKTKQNIWIQFGTPPRFKALRSLYLRLHAVTIHKSNPEHLFVFMVPPGDNPQVQPGTPPCFRALRGDDQQVQCGTTPCF